MSQNPYASPSSEGANPAAKLPGAGILFASVAAVALTTFGGCWVGMGAGYVAGTMAPGVYGNPDEPGIAPLIAGAIGIGQGLGGGAVVGVILVALFYWYRSRVAKSASRSEAGPRTDA